MPGPYTLAQIASQLGGRVVGDSRVLIRQVGTLERAAQGQIAFLANPKYRSKLAGTAASAPRTMALARVAASLSR